MTSPSPAALRQRRHRERLGIGEIVVPVEIGERHIDLLVLAGWLHPRDADNINALSRVIREVLDQWATAPLQTDIEKIVTRDINPSGEAA